MSGRSTKIYVTYLAPPIISACSRLTIEGLASVKLVAVWERFSQREGMWLISVHLVFSTRQRWSLIWTRLWRRCLYMLRTPLFLLPLPRCHWIWASCPQSNIQHWSIAPNSAQDQRKRNPADRLYVSLIHFFQSKGFLLLKLRLKIDSLWLSRSIAAFFQRAVARSSTMQEAEQNSIMGKLDEGLDDFFYKKVIRLSFK